MGSGQDGQPRRNAGNAKLLAGLLHHQFITARFGRRQELAVRQVLNILDRPENADQFLHLVVIRRHVFVTDRPVKPLAVPRIGLKVIGPEAQRDAAPAVGTPSQHAGPEPPEIAAGRISVRFAGNRPSASGAHVGVEDRVGRHLRAVRSVIKPGSPLGLRRRVKPVAGFQHQAVRPRLGQHISRRAAARA